MGGGNRKHGFHLQTLNLPVLAAGSGTDAGAAFVYNAFPNGAALAVGDPMSSVDYATDTIDEASVVTYSALTGQATNFASIVLQQWRAGAAINDIRVVFSAAGIVTAAEVPINLAVVSGATVTGAGTGTLTVTTGAALPWTLQFGDVIVFARISNNATGLATPSMSCTLSTAAVGA